MSVFKKLGAFLFGIKSCETSVFDVIDVTLSKLEANEPIYELEVEEEESEWISPSDETLEQIAVECFKLKQIITAFEPNIDDEFIVKQHINSFIEFLSVISGIEICWADVTDSYEDACIAAESSAGLTLIGYKENTKVIYMNQVIKIPKIIDDDIHDYIYDITD